MSFQKIYDEAVAQKGEEALADLLPQPKTNAELLAVPDADYLAEMAKCIFRSGFVWKIVEHKWPDFERVFVSFNPKAIANFSDERIETIAQDKSIIRHLAKINATRENAKFVLDIAEQHKSFGCFISEWPEDDLVGLLLYLKKAGSRLGGHTGQYFLRFSGKDTFIFSRDVIRVLVAEGVVAKEPTSKSGMLAVQSAFNEWRDETGLPYCQLSRIMAASIPG
ncbi:MAG TPA: DNA-3-methyladenine glycosylase I [Pseudomonadales bacterium]|jgi:3-methyladenine DNA glycosylase Tag|nr:3-methyladenine DNA glycosylase [Gammaproteobacteria bacterium]MDP6027151.1 DNA-3-methyladenine glycosylase I [Pseudomonadales bacterium]MDP6314625.1 DNA-3-methyladenine glycosylase I [Pseudomonadales bacterium]MDP7313394.1 DNA-3-methyladenine glycosylase I [Pseudomonadales bacterium]HJL61854.1 DNA-3-methyladenine glycosylase I [Pseudomonadales bacterium]|tara:strand:- start:1781 stop:2446 length:666 start_codon:yes stop_codon:yes gene_type:complete